LAGCRSGVEGPAVPHAQHFVIPTAPAVPPDRCHPERRIAAVCDPEPKDPYSYNNLLLQLAPRIPATLCHPDRSEAEWRDLLFRTSQRFVIPTAPAVPHHRCHPERRIAAVCDPEPKDPYGYNNLTLQLSPRIPQHLVIPSQFEPCTTLGTSTHRNAFALLQHTFTGCMFNPT